MRFGAGGWLFAGCVVAMSTGALAVSLSSSLKNYYAQYETVLQCAQRAQLSEAEVDLAKTAIVKIETHYLKRDSSIDKDRLLQQAVADKDEGFRIVARKRDAGLLPYCRMSLRELLTKAREIDPGQ